VQDVKLSFLGPVEPDHTTLAVAGLVSTVEFSDGQFDAATSVDVSRSERQRRAQWYVVPRVTPALR
jgi:hypothetical protein